jgi:hypothetical protein
MAKYEVSFNEIEDGVAKLKMYKNGETHEYLRYRLEDLPEGIEPSDVGKQFRPEFDDEEIVALRYDEELTERRHEEAQSAIEDYEEMLEDS